MISGSNKSAAPTSQPVEAARANDTVSIVRGSGVSVNGDAVAVLPLLVDVRQAAKLMNISAGTVRNLVLRGELRPVRLGRRVLFSVEELRRFIALRTGAGGAS